MSSSQPQGIHSTGLALETGTPIVVKLDGSLHSYVYEYFKDNDLIRDELEAGGNRRDKFYEIFYGKHSKLAARWLVVNKVSWKIHSWFVTVLPGGHSVDRYRQLARFENHRHLPSYNIRLPFYDELNYLMKTEFESLSA